VPTAALAGDIRGTLHPDHALARVVAQGGRFNDTARALAKIANENAESWMRTIIEVGEGCDVILVAGLAAFAGFSAAEYLGAKGIGAGMIPITPTAAFPSPFLPAKWVPRPLNRASHGFVNAMLWKAFRDKTNVARALFKLPLRKVVWADHPMLYGVSCTVAHACRLADQRTPLRTVAGAEPCLDAATGAGELPCRRRSPNLYRLREHDWLRQRAPAGCSD
jgi:sterol 3beta-glucosyltransferase